MPDNSLNSNWRKVASSIYKKPVDGKIFGSAEIDVTDLEVFVNEKRKEGLKITLTHIFTLIVSRALKEIPELNTYVKRGNIIHRDSIDPAISVLIGDEEMTSVVIRGADKLNLKQLEEKLTQGIYESRGGSESKTMKNKGIGKVPWPFRQWLVSMVKLITVKWGLSIPGTSLNANSFGSFVMTNIGSIGLDTGYPSLFPISNVSFVFVLGGVNKKPWVVDDKVEIRRILTISAALDHRTVDAISGGKLFRTIKRMVRTPEELE